MRRALIALALVTLVLATAPAGVAAGATLSTSHEPTSLKSPLSASLSEGVFQANETPTPNGTSTSTTSTPGARPPTADTVRILPLQLEPDFVSVETANAGEVYNTTGPFALFTLSEPVDQAAIQQPGARARILEGGTVVLVEYDSDAAPPGKQSLYELRLFFEDGSSRTVSLFATRTDVDVGSTNMAEYRPFVLEVLDNAEDNGYDRDPEGALQHYEDVRSQAQLLESLLTEQALRLWGSLISIVLNPLGIAAILVVTALIAAYLLRSNRSVLEILTNSTSQAEQLRERLWIQYKKDQQTAADEPLREIVPRMGEIYWKDAYDVDTVAGLAELFRRGFPVEGEEGELTHKGGVEELDAETIASSWLEPVTRDRRIATPELALSHGKAALKRMITKYGMGHIYGDAYQRTVELIDELDESRDPVYRSSGAAPGGDD